MVPSNPDRPADHHPAAVLIAAAGIQVAFGLAYAWSALAPFAQAQSHWSRLGIMLTFSASSAGYGAGLLAGGALVDSIRPHLLVRAAAVLMGIAVVFALRAPSELTFVPLYGGIATGIAGGCAMAAAVARTVAAFPSRVGAVGGALTGSYSASALVYVPLAGGLASHVGWITAVRTLGTAAVTLALAAAFVMPAGGRLPRGHRHPVSPRELIRRPAILLVSALAGISMIFGGFAMANLGIHIVSRGMAAGAATAALTAAVAGVAGGRLLAGLAADQLGSRPVLAGTLISGITSGALLAVAPPLLLTVAAGALAGLSFGGPAGSLSRLAADVAPDGANFTFGLLFASVAAGATLGPVLGALAPSTAHTWLLMVIPEAGGLVLLALLAPRRAAERVRWHAGGRRPTR